MSDEQDRIAWPLVAAATIVGSTIGGIGAALLEASLIASPTVGLFDVLPTALSLYLTVGVLAGAALSFVHVAAWFTVEHAGEIPLGRILLLCGLSLVGGLGMWGVATLLSSSFGSAETHAIGTGIVAAALTLLVATVATRRSPDGGRKLGRNAIVYCLATTAVLLAAALAVLNPTFIEELRPMRFAPSLLPVLLGFAAGAHVPGWPRRRARTTVGASLAVAVVAFALGASAAPNGPTRLAISQSDLLLGSVEVPGGGGGEMKRSEGSATCNPNAAMPTADSIGAAAPDAPDIILLTVDSLRWDHTSMSGYERKTTPNLARLAGDGALFSRAYPPASSTRQTFRGLFTGLHPSLVTMPEAKRWALALPDGQETLASYLNAAGYSTAAVMTATNTLSSGKNATHGFETVDHSPRTWWDERKYSAPLMIDRIIAHVSDANDERPKFAWAHLMEPHQKYHPGPEPKLFGGGAMARYDSAIHFVDGEIARMIEFVRSPARRKNTWLFITADHGHAFKEHGNRFHGHTVYEEETRVPLLVFGPGVKGSRFDVPVSLLNLFPTILSTAGLTPFEALCGVDLTAGLTGAAPMPERPVFVEQLADESNDAFHVAWFDLPLKLLVRPKTSVFELYNLDDDPQEKNNLAPTRTEDVKRLTKQLTSYLEERGMDPSRYGL